MVKHSKTPWEIRRGGDIYSDSRFICSTIGASDLPESIRKVDLANAELIVKAVNSFIEFQGEKK